MPRTLNEVEDSIRQHLDAGRDELLALGADLIEAKELVAHGEWGDWLWQEFNATARTAQRLMKAARDGELTGDIWGHAKREALPKTTPASYSDSDESEEEGDEDTEGEASEPRCTGGCEIHCPSRKYR